MTIGFWITAAVVFIIGMAIGIFFIADPYERTKGIIAILITLLLVVGIVGGGYWYCNNTAGGARALKDQKSELNNGLMREITITAEDGRQIFYYKGKCDIETDHSSYILFEDEDGYRHIIYKGIQDTIIVSELED